MMLRRTAFAVALVTLVAGCASEQVEQAPAPVVVTNEFAPLESEFGARLGVFAVDTGSGKTAEYRADERFPFASTFKALAAGAILTTTPVDALSERVKFSAADVVVNSPIAEKHVDDGMTLREVIDAALRYSDNTAGNLMFARIGGPDGLERILRGLGDTVTEMDRIEPALNEALPGDVRDTSSPRALAADLRQYTLGDVLHPDARTVLTDMMLANTTGNALIRAGVPGDWAVGDKTAGAAYGTRNDIAVIWPPNRAPLVVAIMTTRDQQDAEYVPALVAKATRVAVRALG
ncbi:class A beta-lactamase [Nocardia camponoti]|uniref:Beta-lactamase n=1 Tax=Nocardia camponoti TaxID=1616106 RepID=A0A917Q903_9NOCA|nr:class A beta-lactamase [Nocardia camponoti]GGK35941.1 beta-lactamase [Nocardia camponoti]